MHPLLLERVGEKRIKSTGYIPPRPFVLPQGLIYAHIFDLLRISPLRRDDFIDAGGRATQEQLPRGLGEGKSDNNNSFIL